MFYDLKVCVRRRCKVLLVFAKHTLDFACQTGENIIIYRRIIMRTLLLIEQSDVYQRHERYGMVGLATFVMPGIGIIALRDELGCRTIELLFLAVDHHVDFFIVDVQSDM